MFRKTFFRKLKKNRNSDRNSVAFPIPFGISEQKFSESKLEGATEFYCISIMDYVDSALNRNHLYLLMLSQYLSPWSYNSILKLLLVSSFIDVVVQSL